MKIKNTRITVILFSIAAMLGVCRSEAQTLTFFPGSSLRDIRAYSSPPGDSGDPTQVGGGYQDIGVIGSTGDFNHNLSIMANGTYGSSSGAASDNTSLAVGADSISFTGNGSLSVSANNSQFPPAINGGSYSQYRAYAGIDESFAFQSSVAATFTLQGTLNLSTIGFTSPGSTANSYVVLSD